MADDLQLTLVVQPFLHIIEHMRINCTEIEQSSIHHVETTGAAQMSHCNICSAPGSCKRASTTAAHFYLCLGFAPLLGLNLFHPQVQVESSLASLLLRFVPSIPCCLMHVLDASLLWCPDVALNYILD